MKKKEGYENNPKIVQEEKEEMKMNVLEKQREPIIKQFKQIRRQTKIIKRLKTKNLIIKILLIIIKKRIKIFYDRNTKQNYYYRILRCHTL